MIAHDEKKQQEKCKKQQDICCATMVLLTLHFLLPPLTSTFQHLFLRPHLQTNLLNCSLGQGFLLFPTRGHLEAVQFR